MILDFQRDFRMRTGYEIELVSLDDRDGADKARVYDITQYPALVALDDRGSLRKVWQGDKLPLMNEVSFYTTSIGSGGY